ncbi:response regulator [Pelomonas sp. KK5]|uniref:response regulator n=1 Tax=Pelomonas sp. KK5 TaxID=1855730 RepID=UPI00097C6841|nr:response regulator [Pelomonas sp. KK5]
MVAAQPKPTSAMKVLVIDDQQQVRQIIRESLYRLGIRTVVMAANAQDAMRAMRSDMIDLVLSDYNLGEGTDGQQLLEAARSGHLLSPVVPWIFITANSLKGDILAAGDYMPDGYIVKPFTDQLLSRYIEALSARKQALAPLLMAVDSRRWEHVLTVAEQFAERRDALSIEGLKHKANALMRLARFEDAREVYERALAMNSELAWAQLGHAQALRAMGKAEEAHKQLKRLTFDQPAFAAAYDTLLEIAEDRGDQDEALELARKVADLVPNAKRKLKLGSVALTAGDNELAVKALESAVAKSRHAVVPTPGESLLLAQALVNAGDPQKALGLAGELAKRFPNQANTQYLAKALSAQAQGKLGNAAAAAELMNELKAHAGEVELDESGKLLLARTALSTGQEDFGQQLISEVARNNSDRPMMLAAAMRAAAGTAREAELREQVMAAGKVLEGSLQQLQAAKRSGDLARALEIGEAALAQSPQHFSVLIELCTLHLIAMTRLGSASEHADRARALLDRLESSNPDHDRVAAARKFFRERVGAL